MATEAQQTPRRWRGLLGLVVCYFCATHTANLLFSGLGVYGLYLRAYGWINRLIGHLELGMSGMGLCFGAVIFSLVQASSSWYMWVL